MSVVLRSVVLSSAVLSVAEMYRADKAAAEQGVPGVALMENAGCACYRASTHGEAIKMFKRDTDVGVAVIDYEMPGSDAGDLIETLRDIRPAVTIVGNSSGDQRLAFEEIGVRWFLKKPWQVAELDRVLKQAEAEAIKP